jgi:hypothetical protein
MSREVRHWVAALALAGMAGACSGGPSPERNDSAPTNVATAHDGGGGPPPTPRDVVEPVGHDPVAPLPPSSATDRLVVSTVGDDQSPLLLVDLSRHRVVPLGDPGLDWADAAFSSTSMAFTIDSRTLGVLDVEDPDSVRMVSVPDNVPGVISSLVGDSLGFIVAVGVPQGSDDPYGPRDPAPYVLYGPSGDLRCVTDARIEAPGSIALLDGVLWLDHLATEVDRTDCATRPGLQDVPNDSWVTNTTGGVVVLAVGDTVMVYDSETGIRRAESEPLGGDVGSVVIASGAIWTMADTDIVKLDAGSLEVEHRAGPLDCDGDPYLVEGGGSVWMVDDCSGILAEVDPATGDYVDAWSLPTDRESDQDIDAVAMGDGIWFVDVEQTGEPYRFDFSARRFERMPIARDDAEPIYALVWDVMAGP